MLKCASLYTFEVDNPEIALSEIKEQLAEKITLMGNTTGIVICHPEFVLSGVLKFVCENLPFDLTGVTTSSQAVNGMIGEIILTIFVMTSDDIHFITGVTEGLVDEVDGPVRTAYEKSMDGISEIPKLALVFPPFMPHGGDRYVEAMEKITPKTPVFGTRSIDDTAAFTDSETIYNGENYKCEMSFVLCFGNINPRFLIATVSDSTAISSSITVTKASGNYVYEINNMNTFEYFAAAGLVDRRGAVVSFQFFPIKVDPIKREDYDGIPVILGLGCFLEDGTAVFYGDVAEGSTITIMKCDVDDILFTTSQTIKKMNVMDNVNGALLFPCVVRRSTLSGINKPLLELQTALTEINPQIPFMLGYAGGEICPTSLKNGVPVNRFHNYSLVVLVV